MIKGKIKSGQYFDSVSLMIIGKKISAMPDVEDGTVVMGTNENKSILKVAGLYIDEYDKTNDTDLIISIKFKNNANVDKVMSDVDLLLKEIQNKTSDSGSFTPKSIDGALKSMPNANICLISVAGKYAFKQAMTALENNLHVMLFSDNVSVEKEIELKKYAKEKGLLVMGPDCGTAIINGIPLAFANIVSKGDIGLVAASGTGLQEVTTLISNNGGGISQAIGTGGRDVKEAVGGIMFIESLKALNKDENTKIIVLISKPPHFTVLEKIKEELNQINKPIVTIFLGADKEQLKAIKGIHCSTLEEASLTAVCLSKGKDLKTVAEEIEKRESLLNSIADSEIKKKNKSQKYLRGLFSGGTFCDESKLLLKSIIDGKIYSNGTLENLSKSQEHTVIDLGDDDFTVGRPHPMIDYTLRNRRILEEANDFEVSVILLDIVLGYGSNLTPAEELIPIIKQINKQISIVCSVTGTDRDIQNKQNLITLLEKEGVIVMPSNSCATKLAGKIIKGGK